MVCATSTIEDRATRLAALVGSDVPACSRLAARVYLLARCSLHRGEVFQRGLLSFVVWLFVAPFLRAWHRAQPSSAAFARRQRLIDHVADVAAWANFRGPPRGAEQWEPLAAWWACVDDDKPVARWRWHALEIGSDLAYAAESICMASPRAFADALRRIVENCILARDEAERDELRRAYDLATEAEYGDDLRALVDAHANATWDVHEWCLRFGGPPTWDHAQNVGDAEQLREHEIAEEREPGPSYLSRGARTQVRAALECGLSPLELLATRVLGISPAAALRLRVDGYLTLVLREAHYGAPELLSLVERREVSR